MLSPRFPNDFLYTRGMRGPGGPWISVRTLWPFLAATKAHGANVERIVDAVGLDWSSLLEPSARLAQSSALRLIDALTESANAPNLGFDAARWWLLSDETLVDHVGLSSKSLIDSDYEIGRYARLLYEAVELSSRIDEHEVVRIYAVRGVPKLPPVAIDFVLATMVVAFERFALPLPTVRRVTVTYPRPCPDAPIERFFQVPVVFEAAENSVAFDRRAYEAVQLPSNPGLQRALRAHLDGLVAELPPHDPHEQAARDAIAFALGRQETPLVPDVAKAIGLSESTLRQRLREAGTSFSELLDDARRDRAVRLLEDPTLTLTEIALRLGFNHQTAFSRAFKRWTSETPSAFRQRQIRNKGAA